MLQRLIDEDITLVIEAAPAPLAIKADLGQLEQVLMNLAINARDAMVSGGTLKIATRHAQLTEPCSGNGCSLSPGSYAVLEVADTGVGMNPDTLARIFEPFFTTKDTGRGTGLGLSTVYGIVQQWQGAVAVKSEFGKGSTFSVHLPIACAPLSAPPARTHVAVGRETILIVEDEDVVRVTSQRMARAAGYDVLAVANAAEALLILDHHEQPVDLLLTDVVMPNVSGPDLVAQATRGRPQLAVLYMTGHTDNPAMLQRADSTIRHVITKPFSASDLNRSIREALDGASSHSETAVAFTG